MPVWMTKPVQQQRSLTLEHWTIRELSDGDRHIVGYCVDNAEGRVSSAIANIDPESLHVTTETGRCYVLSGHPGMSADAEFVWNRWTRMHALTSWTDVSASVWEAHMSQAKRHLPANEVPEIGVSNADTDA